MNRTRLIIVALLVLVVVGVVVALAVVNQPSTSTVVDSGAGTTGQQAQPEIPPTEVPPTAPPIEMISLLIAVQDIPRGTKIDSTLLAVVPWPAESAPVNALSNIEDAIGKIARTDIFREQPVLGNVIVTDYQTLSNIGSDAALITPPNRVSVAIPMNRLTSVAYALQPGDRIDIIASLLFIDVDQTFQSAEPNSFSLLSVSTTPADPATGDPGDVLVTTDGASIQGAFDTRLIPTVGSWPVIVSPSEAPRPRLAVQRTVQDALVIWIGDFPADGKIFKPAPTPTPIEPTATPEGGAAPEEAAPPPPTANPRDIITVAVSPQDAVVLTWYVEAGIPFTFALRSAATTTLPQTDPVTLDYIMTRFNILVPEKFNYALEPAIRSIRRLEVGDQITLESGVQGSTGG